ncbi:MAG: bifunctional [glutamate--ammonia ligase]-adenylyl-L-tyrosine phosphorylase/[glutamate--ammonia-ligase] adenylyltransferase [Cycloclasticus sp.]
MHEINKNKLLQTIPTEFHEEVGAVLCELPLQLEDIPLNVGHYRIEQLARVLACSRFVQSQMKRFPEVAMKGLTGDISEFNQAALVGLMAEVVATAEEATVMRILRRYRNQTMAEIAWQDISGEELESILHQLSALADVLIQCAVAWSYQLYSGRFGIPRDELGKQQQLMVIGMGKLGANELNFSSDIDLIFCYPAAGETDGSRAISNEEFFTRMCRLIVKLLDQQTVDGFVFRVDTRLRPFGDSGALVLNSDAMEIYYQSHAREWERYAMVKARVITGCENDKAELQSMIKSFVFRRYLDYGVFDSIRVMKRQIESQLQQKGVKHNVKLGPGGIREIEFIGQAFQLIRGGRDKSLQERGILKVLELLAEKGQIPRLAAQQLTDDYRYLRRLENHIQEIDDKQTHDLPKDEINRARLALSMEFDCWEKLFEKTHQTMQRVHQHFESLVDFVSPNELDDGVDWLELDTDALDAFFKLKGVIVSDEVTRDILHFCQSYPVRQLQEKGRQYMSKLLPKLVDALLIDESHERTLSAFLKMLEKICNRVVYLVLLVENPAVFKQLTQLAILSPWIVTQVTRWPILLDELIDPQSLFYPPSKVELQADLNAILSSIEVDDIEGQMEALRLFKQVNVLRIAASDLTGVLPVMVVSDKLTDIAEVMTEKVLALSWQSVCARYGVPADASADVVSGFAVVGFGKMGGIELGFGSDLDLIFLHKDAATDELTVGDRPTSLSEFYMRLGRKIITFMATRTFSGELYEVDLRLRPNGQSGLLVTGESAFERYQKNNAWTWEHQALIRARFVAGSAEVAARFKLIRDQVLANPRDTDVLRNDVIEMREKMRASLLKAKEGCFDLKHGVGGIVDIEFIVQFGVLANASRHDALLKYTDNIRLLQELGKVGFLSSLQQQGLNDAYKAFREATHHASLAESSMMKNADLVEDHVRLVSSVWNEIILNS